MKIRPSVRPRRFQTFFAVWYFCISAGFLLLGIRAYILGAASWTVVLRWVIAAGFAGLALLELRKKRL